MAKGNAGLGPEKDCAGTAQQHYNLHNRHLVGEDRGRKLVADPKWVPG